MWKPWDGGIYLMAPTKDVQQGEYGLVDTEFLEQLPQLEYFKQRPGRACLIIWTTSTCIATRQPRRTA